MMRLLSPLPARFKLNQSVSIYLKMAVYYTLLKTDDRKSLVPLTLTAVCQGVTIVLIVPLIGLNSKQVDKASMPEHSLEAYLIDQR